MSHFPAACQGCAPVANSLPLLARAAAATPGIFTVTFAGDQFTLWATGLGALDERRRTRLLPRVTDNGVEVEVLYSGVAPGFPGHYQVNARRAPSPAFATRIRLEIGGAATEIVRP